MGFMMLGLSTGSYEGTFSALYYFFIYIMIAVQIFSILLVIKRNPKNNELKNLVEFSSISSINFSLSFLLVLCLLSLAGVPPLAGFFGKILIF